MQVIYGLQANNTSSYYGQLAKVAWSMLVAMHCIFLMVTAVAQAMMTICARDCHLHGTCWQVFMHLLACIHQVTCDCASVLLQLCIFVMQAIQHCVNQRVKYSCSLQMAVYMPNNFIDESLSLQSQWYIARSGEWLAVPDLRLPNHSAQIRMRVFMTTVHPVVLHICVG